MHVKHFCVPCVPVKAKVKQPEEAFAPEKQVLGGEVRSNRWENHWSEDNKLL